MRNPFRLRAAQRAVSDEQFVKLFGAGALDLLDDIENPWGGLVFLRSAPGGGKTSFLRLLTPRPLKIASSLQNDPYSKSTYEALRKQEAINASGPQILGVMAAFSTEYEELEDIDKGGGLFRALLNARIVIATVRAALERSDRTYPDDLETIKTKWQPDTDATIPAEATGRDLYDWASQIERGFYERLDELGDDSRPTLGHTRLDAISWFARAELSDASGPIDVKRVLMFDDLQYLSKSQRISLTNTLTTARESCGIWVAERMEALDHNELLSEGVLESRDYEAVIHLEKYWAGKSATYSKLVGKIAELRARRADGFEDRDFFTLLADNFDAADWTPKFEQAIETIHSKLVDRCRATNRYETWLDRAKNFEGTVFNRALEWRTTQVLVERDLAKSQPSFEFDSLSEDEYAARDSSGVHRAAELFLRSEIGAPIYFGRDALTAVSSTNVDQYVEIAGDIFEEMSAKITGPRDNPAKLTADRQHAIIKKAAESRWNGLVRRIPNGFDARQFLEGAGAFCKDQTYRPTAPYPPGVTGFAIAMDDRKVLLGEFGGKETPYHKLRDVLTSLVAHNLISPRFEQRNKGRDYVIFYLNRILCVNFDLPLGYGGWREKSLRELNDWVEHGSKAVKGTRLVD